MILTGNQILSEHRAGRITIEPMLEGNISTNSYSYRLGNELAIYDGSRTLDFAETLSAPRIPIPQDGLLLDPRCLYLGSTLETIGSNKYVTSLIGKSSIGRLGLFVQISANLGHQGSIHKWTLELRCCLPLVIYPEMNIGQVTFWISKGIHEPREGYYSRFSDPREFRGWL